MLKRRAATVLYFRIWILKTNPLHSTLFIINSILKDTTDAIYLIKTLTSLDPVFFYRSLLYQTPGYSFIPRAATHPSHTNVAIRDHQQYFRKKSII